MTTAAAIRAAILAADDLAREPVDVPWDLDGAKLYVRGMTSAEKDRYVARTRPDGSTFRWAPNITAEVVCTCLVTEDGEQVLELADAGALGERDGAVLGDLFMAVMRLSGLTAGTTEQVEADFGSSPGSGSATD